MFSLRFTHLPRLAALSTALCVSTLTTVISTPETAHADLGDTTFSWGGYVKLDAIYSSNSRGRASDVADYVLAPGAIPVPSSRDNDNVLNFSARESRLWFKTKTPNKYGDIGTHIEFDFLGFDSGLGNEVTSNPSAMRLRHAFGTWRGFMIGQGWGTWMDLAALPEINDFGSPAGRIFVRQGLIRYTSPLGPNGELQVAVENTETTLTQPSGARLIPSDDITPDGVVKFTQKGDWGHMSISGIVRGIRSDSPHTDEVPVNETEVQLGFGGQLSGKIMIGKKHNLRFSGVFGSGIGRYIALGGYNDGEIDATGNIELTNIAAATFAAQLWLTETLRINLVGSASQALNNSDELAGLVNKQYLTSHSNIMWNAAPSVRLSIEHIFAQRTIDGGQGDDETGDLHRVQASAMYTF